VAGEFALLTVERSKVTRLAEAGDRRAKRLQRSLRTLSFQLSGAQLGITMASLILGAIAEPTIATLFEPIFAELAFSERATVGISVAIALALATAAQLVVGELVPKNLAIAHPYRAAILVGIPLQWLNRLARPLIQTLNAAADWSVRRLGIEPRQELAGIRSLEELDLVIRASGAEGEFDQNELSLLTRSMTFTDKIAADVMIPRVDVDGIAKEATLSDLTKLALSSGHSRFPVYSGDLDHNEGVVHVRDILRYPTEQRSGTAVTAIAFPALSIPETRPLDGVLLDLQKNGRALALVGDEYGGTAGIITMEDLLEEIFGEIEDEYDQIPAKPLAAAGDRIVLDGLLHRHDVDEAIGFEWPEGHYETLGGFVTARFGHFPVEGDRVVYGGFAFTVEKMDGRRVAEVSVLPPQAEGKQ
jgi:CBS domain containing-hemolysin-like protein